MDRIVAQHLLDGRKFVNGLVLALLLALRVLLLLSLLASGNFFRRIHGTASSGLLKKDSEVLAGAVELTPHRISGLVSESGHLVVAHLFIGDEQQQQPIFCRETIQSLLDALAQFFGFERFQRRIGFSRGAIKDKILRVVDHVPLMPGLLQVTAMINGDAIEPGAPGRFSAKLVHLAEGFQEHIVRGVFCLLRVAQEAQSQVINRPAMLFVQFAKFPGHQPGAGRARPFFFQRLAQGGVHWGLDSNAAKLSRLDRRSDYPVRPPVYIIWLRVRAESL
jgi:hypothetical protein